MIAPIARTMRQRAEGYRALAAECRGNAIPQRYPMRRRDWIIAARHYVMEAQELTRAATHAGWRLP